MRNCERRLGNLMPSFRLPTPAPSPDTDLIMLAAKPHLRRVDRALGAPPPWAGSAACDEVQQGSACRRLDPTISIRT